MILKISIVYIDKCSYSISPVSRFMSNNTTPIQASVLCISMLSSILKEICRILSNFEINGNIITKYLKQVMSGQTILYHWPISGQCSPFYTPWTLREKCQYSELFWFVFSRIRSGYGNFLRSGRHQSNLLPLSFVKKTLPKNLNEISASLVSWFQPKY